MRSKEIVTIGDMTYKLIKVEPNSLIGKEYPELYKQLVQEGMKGYWIVGLIFMWAGSMTIELPIYGNSERYVIKWFRETKDKAIALEARQMLHPDHRPVIRK